MADFRLEPIGDRALVRVIARRSKSLPPLEPDRALPTGPGEALVMRRGAAGEAFEAELAARLQGIATVCDQTEAFALFRLSGAECREVLARLVPIDLDAGVFGPEAVAASILHHMPVLLWREEESMVLAGPSSLAAGLAQAIEEGRSEL